MSASYFLNQTVGSIDSSRYRELQVKDVLVFKEAEKRSKESTSLLIRVRSAVAQIFRVLRLFFQGKGWVGLKGQGIDRVMNKLSVHSMADLRLIGKRFHEEAMRFFEHVSVGEHHIGVVTRRVIESSFPMEEGLFRVPGEKSATEHYYLDLLTWFPSKEVNDVHVKANALKMLWRKAPLFDTPDLKKSLLALTEMDSDPQERKEASKKIIESLNCGKQSAFGQLRNLLDGVQQSEVTKMNWENLATVWGPNLISEDLQDAQIAKVNKGIAILFKYGGKN